MRKTYSPGWPLSRIISSRSKYARSIPLRIRSRPSSPRREKGGWERSTSTIVATSCCTARYSLGRMANHRHCINTNSPHFADNNLYLLAASSFQLFYPASLNDSPTQDGRYLSPKYLDYCLNNRVGGGVASPVLSHHRAYGSVPRRFTKND